MPFLALVSLGGDNRKLGLDCRKLNMPHAILFYLSHPPGQDVPRYLDRYAHGFFFHMISELDPVLGTELHELPRKPFTLTPLPWNPYPVLRLTTLDDSLFEVFVDMAQKMDERGLTLGNRDFKLLRVVATPEGHPLAGFTPWEEILTAASKNDLELMFLTPTVFATSKPGGRTRPTPIPDPRLIMGSLLSNWQAFSPAPYSDPEVAALREIFDLDLVVGGFDNLKYHHVHAGKDFFPGFTGKVRLRLLSPAVEARAAFARLGALAYYSGVGAKTPFGLGMTAEVHRLEAKRSKSGKANSQV